MYIYQYPFITKDLFKFTNEGGRKVGVVFDISNGIHHLVHAEKPHTSIPMLLYRQGLRLHMNELIIDKVPTPRMFEHLVYDASYIPLSNPDKRHSLDDLSYSSLLLGDHNRLSDANTKGEMLSSDAIKKKRRKRKYKKRQKRLLEKSDSSNARVNPKVNPRVNPKVNPRVNRVVHGYVNFNLMGEIGLLQYFYKFYLYGLVILYYRI